MFQLLRTVPIALALSLCFLSLAAAQGADIEPLPGETMGEFKSRLNRQVRQVAVAEAADQTAGEAMEQLSVQPSTPTSTGGFGSRVEGSISNFLPFFDFAIDAIDTAADQKSVTVSFSPVKVGPFGEIDLNAKIFEPEPFEILLNQIPETLRTAQKEAIAKGLSDFSDVQWTATYGYQRKVQSQWADSPRMHFGRHPELYEKLISELMGELWPDIWNAIPAANSAILGDCEVEIVMEFAESDDDVVEVDGLVASEVRERMSGNPTCPWARYVEALEDRQRQIGVVDQMLEAAGIDELTAMIDNQPQLTLTYSQREREPLVGQDEKSATLKFELGTRNLNTALREYRRMGKRFAMDSSNERPSAAAALNEVASKPYEMKDKFTIAIVWRQRSAYAEAYEYTESVTDPATGEATAFQRSASLDLPKRDEWCGMLQWSRSLPGQSIQLGDIEVVPRIEGAVEYVNVQGDPNRQNRTVARLSYLLAGLGPRGMTIPITLTWADKSEFLGQQDEVFGAHVGLSYKLGNGGGSTP